MPYVIPEPLQIDGTVCFKLSIPNNQFLIAAFKGAILSLSKKGAWDADVAADRQIAADAFGEAYDAMIATECEVKEPPFWAEDDEVDDDIDNAPDYPWYEKIEDWWLSTWLAMTFSPAAGIIYKATIPKIRIFFRRQDWGGQFSVFWSMES